jgi:ATP-dependent exoDNAse (exonuclease V) beta subunit
MPAWSYSAIKVFETCPRKYHAEKVAKLYPFTETEATRFGVDVHKAAEEYIRDGKPMPPNYDKFKPALDALANIPGEKHCEIEFALTEDLTPTGFKADNVWVRGIADLLILNGDTAYVVDYKTGSAKYPDKKQLELMALMTFKHYPDVVRVKAALVFLVHDVVIKAQYNREDEAKLWGGWQEKAMLLGMAFGNNNWPPKPNGLCRKWCPVEHCEFSGD